jgi:hypothetical protein
MPGGVTKTVPAVRPIRVALETKRILNDLPEYLPGGSAAYDAAKTQTWLNTFRYANYPISFPNGVLKWTDFADMPKDSQKQILDALGGNDKELIANFNANRLVIGKVPAAAAGQFEAGAGTFLNQGDSNLAFAFPDMKVAGTVIYNTANSPAFSYDKPEFTYVVFHEAKQLYVAKAASQGTSFAFIILAMYGTSNDAVTRDKARKAFYTWNQLEVATTDLVRVAGNDPNNGGNVSWSFYSKFLTVYWQLYKEVLQMDGIGSLQEIKTLDAAGKLGTAAGQQVTNFAEAFNNFQAIFNVIKNLGEAWEDLLGIQNNFEKDDEIHLAYRFIDPAVWKFK